MAKISIPNKVVTSVLEADEVNQIVQVVNENADIMVQPSHAFSEEHFIQDGTALPPGATDPVPVIKLRLNPDHFEIVGGMISIKAGLLA